MFSNQRFGVQAHKDIPMYSWLYNTEKGWVVVKWSCLKGPAVGGPDYLVFLIKTTYMSMKLWTCVNMFEQENAVIHVVKFNSCVHICSCHRVASPCVVMSQQPANLNDGARDVRSCCGVRYDLMFRNPPKRFCLHPLPIQVCESTLELVFLSRFGVDPLKKGLEVWNMFLTIGWIRIYTYIYYDIHIHMYVYKNYATIK